MLHHRHYLLVSYSIVIRRRTNLETARNQLIYSQNLILLGIRPLNLHTQNYFKKATQSEKLMQRYKPRKGKAEKPKDTKIKHTVQKIMPGEHQAIVGCSTNRRHKDISLLKLPTAKPNDKTTMSWRKAMLNAITRDRVVDSDFRQPINNNKVYICFIYKLSGRWFEFWCCRLNFTYDPCFEQGVP